MLLWALGSHQLRLLLALSMLVTCLTILGLISVAMEFRIMCLQTLRRSQLPCQPPLAVLGVYWHNACLASALRRHVVTGSSPSVLS